MEDTGDHFRGFAVALERAISRYGDVPEDQLLERQKNQVERLVGLESEFKATLIQHAWGPSVYRDFITFICDERKNILAARPYFRERQEVFTAQISKALKKRADKALYRFHFNYQFILFVMKARPWGKKSKLVQLAKQISDTRTELVEMNMPLAISRARIFWSRTPKAQLSFMDLIQISCEGLMSAVDKFCLPYSKVFRSVAIGRMVGNFIEQYSETQLHFYPIDKRKIYRANKFSGKHVDGVDFERLADEVNNGVDPAHRTSAAEIADLMSAASCVSTDSTAQNEPDAPEPIDRFQAPAATRPDVQAEENDSMNALAKAVTGLTMFERKLLQLKGVTL